MTVNPFRTSSHCTAGDCVEVAFTESSYCSGGNCVQVGFQTSSHCTSGPCVEVDLHTATPDILLRDSKNPDVAPFTFTPDEWDAFIKGVKDGEFDLPTR